MLETHNLTVRFGGHVAVNAVTCRFEPGTLTAIVGPNGAGKTTYFNLISGQLPASEGRVLLGGRDLSGQPASARTRAGLGRAFQLTNLFPNLSVLENVRLAVQATREGAHRRGLNLWSIWSDHALLTQRTQDILQSVAMLAQADAPVASLPHGDQRKLEVALLNLAVNARDAMPDGGRLTIRTRNLALAQTLSRGAETMPPGQYVVVDVADTGSGVRVAVTDVQKAGKTVWLHRGVVEAGEIVEGDTVIASVDPAWRHGATQGHSGTHMVHAALRQVLGPTATQAGSLNKPGYLRFDFHSGGPLTEQQRTEIEAISNTAVEANYPVHTFETGFDEAKAMGAMALFGENYGDVVRVVEIGGPFSMELCGGTHVASSSQIGPITLIGESSVGSGIRRVEAYVGMDSFRHLSTERALLAGLASSLKVPSAEVPGRVEQLVTKLRDAEREVARLRAEQAKAAASGLLDSARRVGDVDLIGGRVADGLGATELRELATDLRNRARSEKGVVVLFSVTPGADDEPAKVPFVVATTAGAPVDGDAGDADRTDRGAGPLRSGP